MPECIKVKNRQTIEHLPNKTDFIDLDDVLSNPCRLAIVRTRSLPTQYSSLPMPGPAESARHLQCNKLIF